MTISYRIALALLLGLATSGIRAGDTTDSKALTLEGARKVIGAAVVEARKDAAGTAAIAVVDEGGNVVALERLDNTFAAGSQISIGKARTAALFKKPTAFFEDVVNKGRTAMVALNDFTPLRGGVPIVVGGRVVGAIGVSGAASAQRDEEVAAAGAAAISSATTSMTSNTPGPVSFFASDVVAAAFARGAVLFDGKGADGRGVNYQIHASRRIAPGQAEVHTRETDVIYVLDGEVTFVTGGHVVDPKPIAPDEIRGPGIQGGQARKLTKGDVIIVPAGVPHWFKDVPSEFRYYVVKVI